MKWWIALTLVGITACTADGAKFNVRVCGDVEIPRDVDAFRVVVYDADLNTELSSGSEDLVRCPGDVPVSLPRQTAFDAVEGQSWVRVQGLRQGVVVSTFDRRVNAEEGEDVEVLVSMTRACLGIMCPKGQTCYDGECRSAEFSSGESICKSDVPPTVESPEPGTICPEETP